MRRSHSLILPPNEIGAILAGRKHQLRQPLNPQPKPCENAMENLAAVKGDHAWVRLDGGVTISCKPNGPDDFNEEWRHGKAGDTIWIKEELRNIDGVWHYACDNTRVSVLTEEAQGWMSFIGSRREECTPYWMPRSLCRLRLVIAIVRVQRLHAISPEDVTAEGLTEEDIRCSGECGETPCSMAIPAFARIWDKTHPTQPWASNPFVFVVYFGRET